MSERKSSIHQASLADYQALYSVNQDWTRSWQVSLTAQPWTWLPSNYVTHWSFTLGRSQPQPGSLASNHHSDSSISLKHWTVTHSLTGQAHNQVLRVWQSFAQSTKLTVKPSLTSFNWPTAPPHNCRLCLNSGTLLTSYSQPPTMTQVYPETT